MAILSFNFILHVFVTIVLMATGSGAFQTRVSQKVIQQPPWSRPFKLSIRPQFGGTYKSRFYIKRFSVAQQEERQDRKPLDFVKVLWRFARPHTIIGSALAIPSLHILAAPKVMDAFTLQALKSISYAMIPSLLMNLYITGLNQITDVEIDKVNKPDLPLAAGDLSVSGANKIVFFSLISSLAIGLAHPVFGSQGLNVALWGSAILGTAYSMEPFRLKRFPLLAAFCIVAIRGAIINAGFYAHALNAAYNTHSTVLGCLMNDPRCTLSSLFFAVFGIVIALMKDVPDAAGDAQHNIRSFSVRLGRGRIFLAMRRLITISFWSVGAAFGKGAFVALHSNFRDIALLRTVVALSAVTAGVFSRQNALNIDPEDSADVYIYYMKLWKLFYLSYLVLPFAR